MLKLVPLPSALLLALAFSAPASAQTGAVVPPIIGFPATEWEAGYAKPLDGELALEPDIYARLIRYARASDPATPEAQRRFIGDAEAQELIASFRRDRKYDADEIDAMEELSVSTVRTLYIQRKGDKTSRTPIAPMPALMNALPPELNAMWRAEWDRGADAWPGLVKAYSTDAKKFAPLHARLRASGQALFTEKWRASSAANAFAPFVETLTLYLKANDMLAAPHKERGRQLLFDVAEDSDRNSEGKIPDFLYDWLKPKG
ncbi:MAG: hypothetical protein J0H88_24460 [Sphingomonadales bacterium]|nr:hypothetical protein [Sphingomonadales bacterium]